MKREDDRRARRQGRRQLTARSRSRWDALALRVSRAVAALAISLLAFGAVPLSAAAVPSHRAHTSASAASALNGTWRILDRAGGRVYGGDMTISSSDRTSFSGTQVGDNGAHADVIGSIKGNQVTIREPYTDVPGYVADYTGTIACNGNSMEGTWTDNTGLGGMWTLTRNGPPSSTTNWCSPTCDAHLAAKVSYKTGKTVIPYTITGISRKCTGMTLRAPGGFTRGVPNGRPTQKGKIVLRSRECLVGLLLTSRETRQELALGEGPNGKVFYARGNVKGPEGEKLRTHDQLCTGESGAAVGSFTGDVERSLKLHVGSGAALWFVTSRDPAHVTDGGIDVPAAHVKFQGEILAQRVVLGLGRGRTVTLPPPDTTVPASLAPLHDLLFRPGILPYEFFRCADPFTACPFDVFTFMDVHCDKTAPHPGICVFPSGFSADGISQLAPRFIAFKGLVSFGEIPRDSRRAPSLMGASGRVEFRGGLVFPGLAPHPLANTGYLSNEPQVAAFGDITVRGDVRWQSGVDDTGPDLWSLSTVHLLGTG